MTTRTARADIWTLYQQTADAQKKYSSQLTDPRAVSKEDKDEIKKAFSDLLSIDQNDTTIRAATKSLLNTQNFDVDAILNALEAMKKDDGFAAFIEKCADPWVLKRKCESKIAQMRYKAKQQEEKRPISMHEMKRADFTDAQWERLSDFNKNVILSNEQ